MGIRCLLVSTNLAKIPYPVFPLGIAHLAGALKSEGHLCKCFDLLSQGGNSNLSQVIKEFNPQLIAISIRNLDTVDSSDPASFVSSTKKTVEFIRKYSKSPIVIGGPAFSIFPKEMFSYINPDFGIIGEGEILLPKLASLIERKEYTSERLLYGKPEIQIWKPVFYDPEIAKYYIRHGGMLNIQTKRGCSFKCAYCSYPLLEGKQYRYRDPEEVGELAEIITKKLGAKYIFFTDSTFNDPHNKYLEIAEILIKKGINTPWCAFFRPKGIGKNELKILKKAGLAAMEVGTDASTDETLEGLNKSFSMSDVFKFNDIAAELEIPCAHFIIFGGPNETQDTVKKGIKNIEKLKNSVVFAYCGIRIFPKTKIYEIALREGVIEQKTNLLPPIFYFSPYINKEFLDKSLRNAWFGRFDRIYPCSEMLDRIKFLHQKGYIGPMWDVLVRRRKK